MLVAAVACGLTQPAAAQDPIPVGRPVSPVPPTLVPAPERAWPTALADSLRLLGVEHGLRIAFQEKTRRALEGSFVRDYARSVRMPDDWEDGDSWFVNYVGHPIHGAAAGYLWRDATGVRGSTQFGLSKRYWSSIGKSGAWIAGYSLQFEFGPISEASIGNVGMTPDSRGWVDHAVTPAVGTGMMVAEDALDRYFIRWFENRVGNRVFRASVRMLFNPSRVLANTAQGHLPWHRADRPLIRR